jgi:AraC-like DNA-binding protein
MRLQTKGRELIERLSRSQVYQDYEHAFSQVTGLPLKLRAMEAWHLVHRGTKFENPFCALMAKHTRSCAACLEVQHKIADSPEIATKSVICFAGLCETAVPLLLGDKLVGYLQTGQVLLKNPTHRQFTRTARQLLEWGLKIDLGQLEEAYFHTRVLTRKQYESMISLLTVFSQHLSIVCNQIFMQSRNAEPATITRARQFIQDHQTDDLSLAEVARAVNTSTFYFCKLFKKATGLNFTEYISQLRIEKAKNLLLNPNLRVSEIAYETGFQTLTHFNRVFKHLANQSPSSYRKQLPKFVSA